jgi:anti-sigma factor RsiW
MEEKHRNVNGPADPSGHAPSVVTDADLIRYLDGELDGGARASFEQRVAAMPALAARLEKLSRRSSNLSRLLAEVDPSDGAAGRSELHVRARLGAGGRADQPRRGLWRAVAAVAAILLLALVVPPARAWLLERGRALAGALGVVGENAPEPRTPTVEPDPSPAAGPDAAIEFAVTGDTFDVDVPAADGTLVIRVGRGTSGRAEATDEGESTVVVLASGVRIEGRSTPSAVYSLTLPPSVTTLRVTRRGAAPEVQVAPAPGEELSIRLSPQ